ncbi:tetratricopeptide repeat protein [Tannerella sp.]|uniref:tetratricopeptide repeat protein n=1 Tax=Tannerella sp. TaxID=2382127 RepID=UPI0026DD9A5D|nr:tetratricopeptide repeat protein [Tannerella sp.]MDO4704045.1 tetratricopeptide repeat protein [Tannerella sp.]
MKKIVISLCLMTGCCLTYGQRTHRFESSDRLFHEGKELFHLRNYPGCFDKLNAYKAQSTNRDLIQEADYMLACVAFGQGHPAAIETLEKYLTAYPDTRHGDEICFMLGSAYFAQEHYQAAIEWFNRSEIDYLDEEQQEAYAFRMAYALLQTNDLRTARNYFARIQQVGRTYKEAASYYLAYIEYATGNYEKALNGFNRLKSSLTYREQSLYYITQIHFIENRYDRVIADGEELLRAYPNSANNAEIYRILGNAYYRNNNPSKAIDRLEKYVAHTDSILRGDLYILGVCHYNNGNYAQAIEALTEAIDEEDALTQNAYLYLGQCYLKTNDKNKARMAFEMATTSEFDKQVQETAMYNYALLIHETSFSGFGESVTIFEDFLNRFPDSKYTDKVNDYLAEVYLTTKNYEAALASIEKIRQPGAKIQSARQNVLFRLGTQAFANQQPEKAVDYFNSAIALGNYDKEAYSDAYFWRGEAYYRQNNFSDAASNFRTFVTNTPDRAADAYPLAHYNLGYCHFKQKNYEAALSAFRQYVGLEKNTSAVSLADAYNRIGDCLFYGRQFTSAEEHYTRAASLQPSSGDYALYQKGFLLGLQKDYKGKINLMDRVIREYPESPYADDALYEKGRSYVLMENYDLAADAFKELQQRFPQSSLARKSGLQLGLLYFNNNQPQQSIAAYKKVISDYPGSEEAKTAVQDLKSVYVDMNDVASYASYVNSLGNTSARFDASEQDSLTYFAAEKLFMRGDNEGARRSLHNYLQQFPRGAFSPNANYYLAQIAFAQKQYDEARTRYTAVAESGNTKFLEESVARKAEVEYLQKDCAEAIKSFKWLAAIAETSHYREAARLGIMRCAQQTGQQAEALQAADELLKSTKLKPEVEAEARYLRAKLYLGLHEEEKARTDLQALSKDTRTVYGAEAKYLLARSYFDRNELDKAEKELLNFIEKGTTHRYWLARGFILLSDVYVRKGDKFQARQYLTSLQKNYKGNDDIAGMITERLAKLK